MMTLSLIAVSCVLSLASAQEQSALPRADTARELFKPVANVTCVIPRQWDETFVFTDPESGLDGRCAISVHGQSRIVDDAVRWTWTCQFEFQRVPRDEPRGRRQESPLIVRLDGGKLDVLIQILDADFQPMIAFGLWSPMPGTEMTWRSSTVPSRIVQTFTMHDDGGKQSWSSQVGFAGRAIEEDSRARLLEVLRELRQAIDMTMTGS